jgi:hypothetical protein
MEKVMTIIKTSDWKAVYWFTLGAFVASKFNLSITFATAVGASVSMLLLNVFNKQS